MKKITQIVTIFFLFIGFIVNAQQCWLASLTSDLNNAEISAGFKQFMKNNPDATDAYRVLHDYDEVLKTDVDLLTKLSSDIGSNSDLLSLFNGNLDLVGSWKIISNGKASLRNKENIEILNTYKLANPDITDNAIQIAFESIKTSGSRRQAFINTLKSCTNNSELINSLNKHRLASVEEIRDAVNKLRNELSGSSESSNLGFLEGNIPGYNIDNNTFTEFWGTVSMEVAQLENHIFDAIEATGTNGTWLRITDSEFRMLNNLAEQLDAIPGQTYPDITGTIKIVSENPYCTSCQGVIEQFSDMFPNIEITLIDGIR